MQRYLEVNVGFGAQSMVPAFNSHYSPEAVYIQAHYDNGYTPTNPWTRTALHQHLQYSGGPVYLFEPFHTLPSSCQNHGTKIRQSDQLENAMLPGLFDERVQRKYRRQANFEKWFREDPDWLLGCICPADLCDMPCQWDEIDGCKMFRLCKIRQKYPHPIHGQRPPCDKRTRNLCDGIHDIIEPSCRSLGKQIASPDSEDWQFSSYQACEHVAKLASSSSTDVDLHCRWGHDFEAARVVAMWMYWVHTALAVRKGASGKVQRREDVHAWVPLQPDLGTLHDLRIIDNGAVEGFTFHDHKVVLPWDVYQHFSDRHERRAHALEDTIDEMQPTEQEETFIDINEPEGPSHHLRRAASWSNPAILKHALVFGTRSGSIST